MQIAEYAWTRQATVDSNPSPYYRNSIVLENAPERLLLLNHSIDESRQISPAKSYPDRSWNLEEIHEEDNSSHHDQEGADRLSPSGDFPYFQNVSFDKSNGKPPLTARYPEIFIFPGKEDGMGAAVSLTKAMVWQFNSLFQGQEKIEKRISQIETWLQKRENLESYIAETTERLQGLPDNWQDDLNTVEAALKDHEEVEEMTQLRDEVIYEIQKLEQEIEKIREDIQWSQNRLFSSWKETLAEGGLLEPLVEEVEVQQSVWNNEGDAEMEVPPRPQPTPSEAERWAIEDAREAASNDVREKTIQLQDAQERFDNLKEHYRTQRDAYLACVEAGTTTASKAEFDAGMVLNERDATAKLIEAEAELEQARKHARELGLMLDCYDQESDFFDDVDDGYAESEEAAMIAEVDKSKILNWIDHSEEKSENPADCDQWDAMTVDISDSISAVGEGKDRFRIDRWRSACNSVSAISREEHMKFLLGNV